MFFMKGILRKLREGTNEIVCWIKTSPSTYSLFKAFEQRIGCHFNFLHSTRPNMDLKQNHVELL